MSPRGRPKKARGRGRGRGGSAIATRSGKRADGLEQALSAATALESRGTPPSAQPDTDTRETTPLAEPSTTTPAGDAEEDRTQAGAQGGSKGKGKAPLKPRVTRAPKGRPKGKKKDDAPAFEAEDDSHLKLIGSYRLQWKSIPQYFPDD